MKTGERKQNERDNKPQTEYFRLTQLKTYQNIFIPNERILFSFR